MTRRSMLSAPVLMVPGIEPDSAITLKPGMKITYRGIPGMVSYIMDCLQGLNVSLLLDFELKQPVGYATPEGWDCAVMCNQGIVLQNVVVTDERPIHKRRAGALNEIAHLDPAVLSLVREFPQRKSSWPQYQDDNSGEGTIR